jgi:hypothetical protein
MEISTPDYPQYVLVHRERDIKFDSPSPTSSAPFAQSFASVPYSPRRVEEVKRDVV